MRGTPGDEAEQRLRGAREKLLQRHGDIDRVAKQHFALAVAAGAQNARGGLLGAHRHARQRVGDAEPRMLLAVLALEERIARAAGAHQALDDRGSRMPSFASSARKPFDRPTSANLLAV